MRRSIRGTLILGCGALVGLTVVVFGAALYSQQRDALWGEVDRRLSAHAAAIAAAAEDDEEDGVELELSDDYLARFRGESVERPYLVVWDRDGSPVIESRAALDVPRPRLVGMRTRGTARELVEHGRDGLTIAVGEDIRWVDQRLSRFAGLLIGTGAAVLAFAAVGVWVLCGRVLAPVHRMSAAAAEISASNLSRRIDVHDTEDELGRLAATLNDAFDRLQQAVERQARFTADASHELRTPVAVVLAAVEQALERPRDAADYRDALTAVQRAADRMKKTIAALLTLTRADAGELQLRRDSIDARDLVGETVELCRPLAGESGARLVVEGDAVRLTGDRDRLQEALTNLIANAIHHGGKGGEVRVAVRADGEWVRIEVADGGDGIEAHHLARLFDRFYRVDPARGRGTGGDGLGLSIVKSIVEAHGGTIAVDSEVGRGTLFVVRLPTS